MKELPRGLSPGPTCVPEARALSARLARLSLPYLSSDRAKSRRSPSTSVESFLTVRALGFPREFGFGVRRRGVVVSGLGTVRISVGTLPFRLISFGSFQPGSGSPEGLHAPPAWRADPGRRWPLPSSPSPGACIASSWSGPRDRPVPGSPCLRRRPSRRDPAVGDRWPAEVWPARSHRGLDARRRPAGSGRQLAELPRLRSGALPDDVGVILCRS